MRAGFMIMLVVLGLADAAGEAGVTMKMNGDITIPAGTVHEGLAMTMNGRVQVNGTLRGDAVTMNGDIVVSGTVTGSVRTFNGNVTLHRTARVEGDVAAVNGRVQQEAGAVVRGRIAQGSIFRSEPPQSEQPTPPPQPTWRERWRPWSWDRSWPGPVVRVVAAWATVGFIVLTALIALLVPNQLRRIADGLSAMPGQALLAGLGVWVVLPLLAVTLAVSIVGIPALALMPLAVGLLAVFGFAASSMLLGNRLGDAMRRQTSPVGDTVIGAVVLGVLALIPGVGWLAIFLAVTWGIGGAVLLLAYRVRRPIQPPPSRP